ncbi:hypothetical protein TWF281_003733 [Arthrobotrys megalospora]
MDEDEESIGPPRGRIPNENNGLVPHDPGPGESSRSQHRSGTDRPQRPPPVAKLPITPPDSLLKLLQSQEYSDVTVVVGTGAERRVYQLHKNILTSRSEYFNGAFKHIADRNQSILLRDMLPPIFDIVLEWIYGGYLILEHHQPLILALYRAATFLRLHTLKISIAKQVSKMLKRKRKYGTPIQFDGFDIVRGLFEFSQFPAYFISLRKCTDELALSTNIPIDLISAEMLNTGTSTDANTKFWMSLAISYQKALHATVCSECRIIVSTRTGTGLDRMCCHCSSDEEVEAPKPDHKGKGRADGKQRPV